MTAVRGHRAAAAVVLVAAVVLGACRDDGRDLRDPTAPLPPTTTTTTTLPPDAAAPAVAP